MFYMKKIENLKWIMKYLSWNAINPFKKTADGLSHIMFLFVDHFELAGKEPRLSEWLTKYPPLASKHSDADGQYPKHTWFYALDLINECELEKLSPLVINGFGEIELHWHHAYDNEESFQKKLLNGLSIFQKYGYMRPVNKEKAGCFGFIHGNWSLDNSCGNKFCGVDNEIELLKRVGCYGDFTFPALYSQAQPEMFNSIYYAEDNRKAKSYNKGRRAKVGEKQNDDEFMIFEGPLSINWSNWHSKWHPTIENGDINNNCLHSDGKRIDAWVEQNIHVKGRPEWIFVKVFCHGGQDYKAVLGESTDAMFNYLENKYNDGLQYKLHYVTAREAYNIVKAAEDGKSGDPNDYRDYIIPHPLKR